MSNDLATILTNRSANDRSGTDYYPTPQEVTHALMRFLNITDSKVWEPACGEGHMSKVLEQYRNNVISTDIDDTGYGQNGVNFLETKHLEAPIIITNPPFKLSEQFIVHAHDLGTELIAFLLKSQYWHASRRTKIFEKYPPTWVLPLNWRPDFHFGKKGGSPTMECLWTVWICGETDTKYRILRKVEEEAI